MTKPFNVESQDITQLDALQLTKLLKILLHAEAKKFGIEQRAVEVALNITVSDGGEDGRIEWNGAPDSTDYIPYRKTLFQNKATDMTATECARELVTKKGVLKPLVAQVLGQGGTYVLFTTQELVKLHKQERVKSMRAKLVELGVPNAKKVRLLIYDASQISGWVNCFVTSIISVLDWVGRPTVRGLKPFSAWKSMAEFTQYPFNDIVERRQVISDLRQRLRQPRECARIRGLSGLGKTRTAFEIFNGDCYLQEYVVYIDADNTTNVASLISDWVNIDLEGIVVVDNCSIHIHDQLQKEVRRTGSLLSILTLDYDLGRVSNTNEFKLKQFTNEEIRQMLIPVYEKKIPDIDRIVAFAQGFPQMAVLLANARLNEDPNVGLLEDDKIAEKLLWGTGSQKKLIDEKVLRGCALFDRFGIEQKVSFEYEYIADNVVSISQQEFFECVQRFSKRGIIDRRGRYAQLVPKPLAIRLAAQWWTETREKEQSNLINSIPDSLVDSFCAQIEKLDFLPEVKGLTETLCGAQGSFGQAEVILSDRGSRLFRALVNVNPESTTSALYRVLHNMSHVELQAIAGNARRNLVWALEKLCFHAHLFEEAAWALLLLASSENESWSNNASGIFAQLYGVNLSGTAATPKQRLLVLQRAIDHGNMDFRKVVIEALKNAVDTHGRTRQVGSEYQGTRPPLEEWRAKVWKEIFDYWRECFDCLICFVENGGSIGNMAMDVIGHSIRGLVRHGRMDMLDSAIRRVINLNGPYWPSALGSIKRILEHDTEGMPKEGLKTLHEWLKLFIPEQDNVEERLKVLVIDPPWEHRKGKDGHYIDLAAENASLLATELSVDLSILTQYIPLLLSGTQKQTFIFGRALDCDANNFDIFVQKVLDVLGDINDPNPSLMLGLLSGIHEKSVDLWNSYIGYFSSRDKLVSFYPDMIRTGTINSAHLNKLLALIKSRVLPSHCASSLSYGSVTNHLSAKEISTFCLELSKVDSYGSWTALNIMFLYIHGDTNKFNESRSALMSLVAAVPLDAKTCGGSTEMYNWSEIIKMLMKTEGLEFCENICQQIIASANDRLDYSDMLYSIKPILSDIMAVYGEQLWPLFGEAIILAEPMKQHWIERLLARENSFKDQQESILSILPLELVIEWCKKNLEIAPLFVAGAVNIFEYEGEMAKRPTALFIALLENFGELKGIGNTLSSNLVTRAWSGSLVPHLESEKIALEPLLTHSNNNVRSWVRNYISYLEKSIVSESIRDDEHGFGVS
ncbi:MAG: hypothetical protein GY928_22080 [Colwellia sp.]|nr:hypothetical protein [Colwellia sp.]